MSALRSLWNLLDPAQRARLALLSMMMVLGAAFEAVGVGAIVPFITAVTRPGMVLTHPTAMPLLEAVNITEPRELLLAASIGLIVVFAFKSAYLAFFYHSAFRFTFGCYADISRRMLRSYLEAPYTFHLQRNTGELLKTVSNTTQQFASGFLLALIVSVGEALVLVTLFGLLLILEPLATVGAALLLSAPAVTFYLLIRRRMRSAGERRETSLALVNQSVNQSLGGIREIKILGKEDFFLDRFSTHAGDFADAWRSFTYLNQLPRFFVDSFAAIGLSAIVAVVVLRGDAMTDLLPVIGMFGVAAMRLTPSVNRITTGLNSLRFFMPAVRTIDAELDASRQSAPPSSVLRETGEAERELSFDKDLVLDGVSFRYPSSDEVALDGVDLSIPVGHSIGLVGTTGAGKSTLVDLVLGLLTPSEGAVLADGIDIQQRIESWQRRLGYVPQTIYLTDDSVRRNVAFGLPDEQIDDDRVAAALETAQLHRFVRDLDARMGERGARVSGGEMQRLGIARALYNDPDLLVLDEPTSALDSVTEAAIGRVLDTLRGRKTVLVIAHRMNMVGSCDQIFLLRDGRICDSGTYEELMATSEDFRLLAGESG